MLRYPVEKRGQELFSMMIERYTKHKDIREDEWSSMNMERLVGTIFAKVDKMTNEVYDNKIFTPHMFEEDLVDLLAWTVFAYTKLKSRGY